MVILSNEPNCVNEAFVLELVIVLLEKLELLELIELLVASIVVVFSETFV